MQTETTAEKSSNFDFSESWLNHDGYISILEIAEECTEDNIPDLIFQNGPIKFELTEQFQRVMYSNKLLVKGFKWNDYRDEAQSILNSPHKISQIDLDTVGKIFTFLVKNELSNTGALYSYARDGRLAAVFARMRRLVEGEDAV